MEKLTIKVPKQVVLKLKEKLQENGLNENLHLSKFLFYVSLYNGRDTINLSKKLFATLFGLDISGKRNKLNITQFFNYLTSWNIIEVSKPCTYQRNNYSRIIAKNATQYRLTSTYSITPKKDWIFYTLTLKQAKFLAKEELLAKYFKPSLLSSHKAKETQSVIEDKTEQPKASIEAQPCKSPLVAPVVSNLSKTFNDYGFNDKYLNEDMFGINTGNGRLCLIHNEGELKEYLTTNNQKEMIEFFDWVVSAEVGKFEYEVNKNTSLILGKEVVAEGYLVSYHNILNKKHQLST